MRSYEQYHARRAAIEAAAAARAVTPEARARRLALAEIFASKARSQPIEISAVLAARELRAAEALAA